MEIISVLLVIETAPWNFLLTCIKNSKWLGNLLEYQGRYQKSLKCFEEHAEHAYIESVKIL